jgi:hypothetical protein
MKDLSSRVATSHMLERCGAFEMRQLFTISTFLLLTTFSCVSNKETNDNARSEYYMENELSFFDPYESIYKDGKYQGYIYETWLRQPDNLRMIHETLKKIGYERLISDNHLTSNPSLLWGYVRRPINHIIDSLVITYPLDTIDTKYYREFWQRRENENNDEVVFEILQELSKILLKDESIGYNENLVNDTLYNLVIINRLRQNPSTEQAREDFEYLKSIGMHGSAYNLLFENTRYEKIEWNEQELVRELRTDSEKCCPKTWIIDNSK